MDLITNILILISIGLILVALAIGKIKNKDLTKAVILFTGYLILVSLI